MSRADEIFNDVLNAMQDAEEIGGPEGRDYVDLMKRISAEALTRARTYYSWRVKSTAETVACMKSEILSDMINGIVPSTVASFSTLHNYVDANCYGSFCDDDFADAMISHFGGRDGNEGMPQGMLDYINECQGQIDQWLKSGRK